MIYKCTVIGKVLVVEVEDKFDRAMLFCRAQEFYESQNPDFRGVQRFDIWEYLKWHEKEYKESYTQRWEGFNLPMEVAQLATVKPQTKYDSKFEKIIRYNNIKADYIIGVDKIGSDTFHHEMAHGMYYTNTEYRDEMLQEIARMPENKMDILYNYLIEEGYHPDKVVDEIQAYMVSGGEGIEYEARFREIYNRYTPEF